VLILLDENLLSKKLKKPFVDAGHSVQNVEDMGWRGVKDKELLALAEIILLTCLLRQIRICHLNKIFGRLNCELWF
jgi:hypothetical protein